MKYASLVLFLEAQSILYENFIIHSIFDTFTE